MTKKIDLSLDIETGDITISCLSKTVVVKLAEKLIKSKDFYEMIDYSLDDDFSFDKEAYEIEDEMSNREKEIYRLANYCIDLVSQTVKAINKKSEELRKKQDK